MPRDAGLSKEMQEEHSSHVSGTNGSCAEVGSTAVNAATNPHNPFANILPAGSRIESVIKAWKYHCLYSTAAVRGLCQYKCDTEAELEAHRLTIHPRRVFVFLNLPAEIRNRVYELIVKELGRRWARFNPRKALLPGGKYHNPGLNLLLACKQTYMEAVMYIYYRPAFLTSGLDLFQLRQWAGKAALNKAERWGYNAGLLKLDNRMAKWTQHWVLNIDRDQWIGDILFPTAANANFPTALELREAGHLSDTFKSMALFSRFYEKFGPKIDSIQIIIFEWPNRGDAAHYKGNRSSPQNPTFLALHLVETLTALMPIRGVKSIAFSDDVTQILAAGGQVDFMNLLERNVTSKPIYRGDIQNMMHNLEDLLCAYCPYYAEEGNSVFQPRSRWYIVPNCVRKNLLLLRSILAKEVCWASFRVLRDRILVPVLARLDEIVTARANVGNGPCADRMRELFRAFCNDQAQIISDPTHRQTARQRAQAKKRPGPELANEWRIAMCELTQVTTRGRTRGFRAQREQQDLAEKLVSKMDVVIARIKQKLDVVKADITLCDGIVEVETLESRQYVSERQKRVDEGRSDVDKDLDRLVGDAFDWKGV